MRLPLITHTLALLLIAAHAVPACACAAGPGTPVSRPHSGPASGAVVSAVTPLDEGADLPHQAVACPLHGAIKAAVVAPDGPAHHAFLGPIHHLAGTTTQGFDPSTIPPEKTARPGAHALPRGALLPLLI